MYPSISCLVPTYGRPRLLANTIACFLAQEYPKDKCRLVILDDLGTINGLKLNEATVEVMMTECHQDNVYLNSITKRLPSLPEKYNTLWRLAPESDIYLIFEDDDCQLPWCLKSHAQACEHHGWSYPSHVWSDYGDAGYPIPLRLHTEPTGGRFHGCLGIRGDTLERIGGWPETRQANFDQQLIGRLRETGEPGDPCKTTAALGLSNWIIQRVQPNANETRINPDIIAGRCGFPGYIFRWHTGATHGQSTMQGPGDESWYDRYQPPDRSGPHTIIPAFDDDTKQFYSLLTASDKP